MFAVAFEEAGLSAIISWFNSFTISVLTSNICFALVDLKKLPNPGITPASSFTLALAAI